MGRNGQEGRMRGQGEKCLETSKFNIQTSETKNGAAVAHIFSGEIQGKARFNWNLNFGFSLKFEV
jgi:hypothetical protein